MLRPGGGKRRVLLVLVLLGGLPLSILAVALGAYVLTQGSFVDAPASSFLTGLLMLFGTGVLVVGAGGFVIWRTVASLGSATEIEALVKESGSALRVSAERAGPVVNSVSRMLRTIERQASEIAQVSQQLDSARRELEFTRARLRDVSFTDEVTQLHNRRFLVVRLEEEVARYRRFGRPVSLVLVALDHARLGGEAAGDPAGDELLRGVAQILSKTSRGADVICRYGSDVFAVLLVETPRTEAQTYAEHVGDVLSTSSFGRERPGTSLGIAAFPEGAGSVDEILRGAEEALQTARRAESHRVAVWAGGGVECRVER